VARSVDSTIDWRDGNAASLPVRDDERFSLLTCHQGLQFFPDRPAALRQMRQVLVPGGRIGIATWRSLNDIPAARALNDIAERHVGPIVDARHALGDAKALETLLTDAGFDDVRVDVFPYDVRFADGALFARLNASAVVGMSEKGKAMSEPERLEMAARIAADSQAAISRLTQNGECVFPLTTNIAIARA